VFSLCSFLKPLLPLILLLFPTFCSAQLLINEIVFDQSRGSDWVELYNAGPEPVPVTGWALDDGDAALGKHVSLSLPVSVPVGAYVVVHIYSMGVSDSEFQNGVFHLYTGTTTTVDLAKTKDQVGLYNKVSLSSSTLVDFVGWETDGAYDGAKDRAHQHAVAAGLWPESDAMGVSPTVDDGFSIGRVRDGEDTNRSSDFRVFVSPHQGISNESPRSPYADSLTVDPARRAFSPFDSNPVFQKTLLYFKTDENAVKTLRVFDTRGLLRRTLMEGDREKNGGDFTAMGSGSIEWDGRDDDGVIVPLGLYVVVFEATHPDTGTTSRDQAVVAVGR